MVETEVSGAFTGALPTDHNQYGVTQNDGILQVPFPPSCYHVLYLVSMSFCGTNFVVKVTCLAIWLSRGHPGCVRFLPSSHLPSHYHVRYLVITSVISLSCPVSKTAYPSFGWHVRFLASTSVIMFACPPSIHAPQVLLTRNFWHPLPSEEGTTYQFSRAFTWKSRPASDLDCLICAIFARQRQFVPPPAAHATNHLLGEGCVGHAAAGRPEGALRFTPSYSHSH